MNHGLKKAFVMVINTLREPLPLPEDFRVFLTVVRKQSFVGAAKELGQSPAYVSKRIQILEQRLQVKLLYRTSRKIALTNDGDLVRQRAIQILDNFDDLFSDLSDAHQIPTGALNICGSFGFGRNHLAPAIAALANRYPTLDIRLELFDRVVDIVNEGFDLEILVGDDIPGQHISRHLVSNRRVLCATPEYLDQYGTPKTLDELQNHRCLFIKERGVPFGLWNLTDQSGKRHSIRVSGRMSSNHGEVVLKWALHHQGIVLRSMWDVAPFLEQGVLVRLLEDYSQSANVWAVYPTRLSHSAKLRASVEFFESYFSQLSISKG